MKHADDESVSVGAAQQRQEVIGDCARFLQSIYISGAKTSLIFELLFNMSDAANRASGLTIKLAAEATGLSEDEAYRCIQGIVSLTGDRIVVENGERKWLYQNYEPRSIGGAAQGMSRLLPKAGIDEEISHLRKRASSYRGVLKRAAVAV